MVLKRLHFTKTPEDIVEAFNKKDELLGAIIDDPQWRCHVWEQCSDIKMSGSCLAEVSSKMEELDLIKYGRAK